MISPFSTSPEPVADTFIGAHESEYPRTELSLVSRLCTDTYVRYQPRRRQELHKRREQSSSSQPPCGQPCLAASESYKTFTILANRLGACAVSRASSGPVRPRDVRNRTRSWWPLGSRGGDGPLNCLVFSSSPFFSLQDPSLSFSTDLSTHYNTTPRERSLGPCSVGGGGGPGDPQPRAPQFKGAPCRLFNNPDIIAVLRALTPNQSHGSLF